MQLCTVCNWCQSGGPVRLKLWDDSVGKRRRRWLDYHYLSYLPFQGSCSTFGWLWNSICVLGCRVCGGCTVPTARQPPLEMLEPRAGLTVEFLRFMVLADSQPFFLGSSSDVAGLSLVAISGPTPGGSQADLALLSGSDRVCPQSLITGRSLLLALKFLWLHSPARRWDPFV